MGKLWIQWALAVSISGLLMGAAYSADISTQKLKAYAEIYPSIFKNSTIQHTAYKPVPNRSHVVNLLLDSYNGDTDVDELSAELRPEDQSLVKSDAEIKELAASKGLDWFEYLQITHDLAEDPALLKEFLKSVDKTQLDKEVIAKIQKNPSVIGQICSVDQRMIAKNILRAVKP